ncbi:AP-1-like transcription factor [Elasticomyces elasticus]|nr:AP-1-like transcription factor [Elasticomyces elasticus]KAK4978938.1 DNA-binding transcription factor yap1 [Elasticomyces elasticus]
MNVDYSQRDHWSLDRSLGGDAWEPCAWTAATAYDICDFSGVSDLESLVWIDPGYDPDALTPKDSESPPVSPQYRNVAAKGATLVPVVLARPRREKRKAQNRSAQRAFRERKVAFVKGLQEDVTRLESSLTSVHQENGSLKAELVRAKSGLVVARDVISSLKIVRATESLETTRVGDRLCAERTQDGLPW